MQSNKRNCVECNNYYNIQERPPVEEHAALEQALSNALIVGNILKFLSPQEIIRASLVNRDWCAYSRECLRKKSKKYPICAQITQVNPCRALVDFNTFLQTITGSGENGQDTIIFNGIHQAYADRNFDTHTDCLLNDWKRGEEPLPQEDLTAKIKETYGEVLEKIKFRFIRTFDKIPILCPFAVLIRFIISERREEILELDFGPLKNASGASEDPNFYLLDEDGNPRLFPNLEVFGSRLVSEVPIRAPAIKTLKRFRFVFKTPPNFEIFNRPNPEFPFKVFTNVEVRMKAVKNLVNEIQVFRPSLLGLVIDLDPPRERFITQNVESPPAEFFQTLFTLGQLTSSTLKYLACPLSTFAFMAGTGFFSHLHDEPERKNAFPSLKTLKMIGWIEVDFIDYFSWINFPKNFPQLEKFFLTLVPPQQIIPERILRSVNGPYNYVHDCIGKSVSTLILGTSGGYDEYNDYFYFERELAPVPRVLRLFPNIRHLNLTEMSLKCDYADQTFADIINNLGNLPLLEELNIQPVSLSLLRLDHIFLLKEKLSEFKGMFGEVGLEHLLVYKSSLLYHKRLKKINIHGNWFCGEQYGPYSSYECYSNQTPGYFIVSSLTARSICRYKPGFQFTLQTYRCGAGGSSECTGYVGTSGLHYEHLEPYTTISYTARMYDGVRVFEFLDLLCSSENESSAMQSNEINCAERNDITQESHNMEKQLLVVELVFSNELILRNILEFLSPQDIIRTSMVSKGWCANSRECLRKKSNNYPICAQVTQDNPCRALMDLNNFLETITGRGENNQDTIIFNGIHQACPDRITSHNCLMNDWKCGDKPLPSHKLAAKIQETYGKVLEKIKFRFIRTFDEFPITCPFAMFIKFIISKRGEEILELDFGEREHCYRDHNILEYYLVNEGKEPKLLPKLEVFGSKMFKLKNFPIRVPTLKTLKHFEFELETKFFMPIQSNYDVPLNVITYLRSRMISLNEVKHLVNFVQLFRPSLLRLVLTISCKGEYKRLEHLQVYQNIEFSQQLFTLGQLTSSTLTHLSCTLATFALMAGRGFYSPVNDELERKNVFPSLKEVNLIGWMEVDLIDCFSWMDFPRNFPQLQKVALDLVTPKKMSPVNGPYNYVHDAVCTTVSTLVLSKTKQFGRDKDFMCFEPEVTPFPGVLRLFANIRHLHLTRMYLSCNHTDQIFAGIINELENLRFLEELTIWLTPSLLQLDHIFLQKEKLAEFKGKLGEAGMEHTLFYKSSLLYHKRLKRINIDGASICRQIFSNNKCYSVQTPGYFIVSSQTARLICMYKPGFQFRLQTFSCEKARSNECSSYVGTSGFHFEHLEPYTTISLTQTGERDIRVFEFLNRV